VNSVYTDFSKAFNPVRHQLLGRDVCGDQFCSILMAKILFDRENSKDKNRRRCFQDDIGCFTGESSWTIMFHLVCLQNIGDMI
jgi:hypothetical protein